MTSTYREPINHPSAWTGDELGSTDQLWFDLTSDHCAVLETALRSVQAAGLTVNDVDRSHFDLSAMADELASIEDQILYGRGIVILRGFPLAGYAPDEIELMYWGLGCYFGTGESQSKMGDRVGRVEDISGKDYRERAYRNSVELMMHTDLTDIIAMLSIRQSAQGGLSSYVSAAAIHNEILATHPEYLEPLYRGFHYHRFGAEEPGQAAVTPHRIPVLSEREGHLTARLVPEYVYMAAEELGQPLSELESAALEYFNELAVRPDLRFEIMLQPGEISLINNYTVLHTRDAFEDGPTEAEKRLLLRLWLLSDFQRPVVDTLEMFGTDGISPGARSDTLYAGSTDPLSQLGPKKAAD